MSIKSLKPTVLPPQSPNSTSLDEIIGFLSKLSNLTASGTTTSHGPQIVINITINAPSGGGATVNYKA